MKRKAMIFGITHVISCSWWSSGHVESSRNTFLELWNCLVLPCLKMPMEIWSRSFYHQCRYLLKHSQLQAALSNILEQLKHTFFKFWVHRHSQAAPVGTRPTVLHPSHGMGSYLHLITRMNSGPEFPTQLVLQWAFYIIFQSFERLEGKERIFH